MMTTIKESEDLFSQGKVDAAEQSFLDLLKNDSENPEILNNLGVIQHTKDNLKEAEDYFLKAVEAKEDYLEALLNLADLYQAGKRWEEAAVQLEKCVDITPQEPNLYNRLGTICLEMGNTQKAVKALRHSIDLNPDQKIVKDSLKALEAKVSLPEKAVEEFPNDPNFRDRENKVHATKTNIKIAVLCLPGLQSFLGDIVDFLKTKYEVQTFYTNDKKKIESAVQWADIVWLEWANDLAVYVTNNIRCLEKKLVICRVHRYEVFSPVFKEIRWDLVDMTIFVANFMRILANQVIPDLDKKTNITVIYNGVDLAKFQFTENAPGFNLAVVGYINFRKNPVFWPHILSKLVETDKRYTLHIAGKYQQIECQLYLEHIIKNLGIGSNIKFYGYQNNIHKWLKNKNYLLSTSIHESFGYTIAEAMAMGIKPLIHRFPGSEELWPHQCLFSSMDEVIKMILEKDNYNSLEYYDFVEQRYSLKSQLEKIDEMIKVILNGTSAERAFSTLSCETPFQSQRDMGIPITLKQYHRPDNNVIITGIPRSGTSLLCVLVNNFSNAVCLNEIFYDINSLPRDFAEVRRRLTSGEPIPNRYNSSGRLATDTQSDDVQIDNRIVQIADENVVLGSKVNIPYLNNIRKILDYGYKIIAIVRDPVYTIGSWNSKKASIIPEAHVTDADMHPRWKRFRFTSNDKIERQAQIWNFYTGLIWNLRDRIKIYTYESLASNPEWILKDIGSNLGLEPPANITEVSNQNIDSKYPNIEQIKEAVKKHCPIREVFGYSCPSENKAEVPRGSKEKANELSVKRYQPQDYWEWRAKNGLSPNSADSGTTRLHKDYLRRMIHKYYPNSLLEFGAGVGRLFTEYAGIKKLAFCDISRTYQEEARRADQNLGLGGTFHLCTSVDVTPFKEKEFEIVVAVSILLHQRPEEIASVMSELARIGRKIIVISWYEQKLPEDRITRDTHCYMHDYHGLCRRYGWEMQDIEYAGNQIYFTFSSSTSESTDIPAEKVLQGRN